MDKIDPRNIADIQSEIFDALADRQKAPITRDKNGNLIISPEILIGLGLIVDSSGAIKKFIDSTGAIKVSTVGGLGTPEMISVTETALDAVWNPPNATDIYEVLGIHASIKCAAVVADRVPSIMVLPGYHGALTAFPTSYMVSPTGPTLSTGQMGGIWMTGRGSGYSYINDNGTVTTTSGGAGQGESPFPLYLYGDGAILGCANDNDQGGDLNNISAIVKKVA